MPAINVLIPKARYPIRFISRNFNILVLAGIKTYFFFQKYYYFVASLESDECENIQYCTESHKPNERFIYLLEVDFLLLQPTVQCQQ